MFLSPLRMKLIKLTKTGETLLPYARKVIQVLREASDDIDAIKFATKTLMQFKDVGMFKQFGFAIDKIFDRVHISADPLEESVDNFVQFESVPETLGTEFLPLILKAIKEKLVVEFTYTSFLTEKGKTRKVVPSTKNMKGGLYGFIHLSHSGLRVLSNFFLKNIF